MNLITKVKNWLTRNEVIMVDVVVFRHNRNSVSKDARPLRMRRSELPGFIKECDMLNSVARGEDIAFQFDISSEREYHTWYTHKIVVGQVCKAKT